MRWEFVFNLQYIKYPGQKEQHIIGFSPSQFLLGALASHHLHVIREKNASQMKLLALSLRCILVQKHFQKKNKLHLLNPKK